MSALLLWLYLKKMVSCGYSNVLWQAATQLMAVFDKREQTSNCRYSLPSLYLSIFKVEGKKGPCFDAERLGNIHNKCCLSLGGWWAFIPELIISYLIPLFRQNSFYI